MSKNREINLAVFLHTEDWTEIMKTVARKFGQEWDGKNTMLLGNEQVRCEVQVLARSMGDKYAEYIHSIGHALSGHMLGFPGENLDDVKGNLLHYITRADNYIMVNVIANEESCPKEIFEENFENTMDLFEDVAKELNGGVIAFANGAAFFDEQDNIILDQDGTCQIEDYFPFVYKENAEFLADVTQRQLNRRNENMKYLMEQKIYCMELPVNEDDENVTIRTVEEIAKRAVGVMLVSLYSECLLSPQHNMTVQEAMEYILGVAKEFQIDDLSDVMSPKEYAYVNNQQSTEQEQIAYSWNYEHLYMLEWALGLQEWNMPVEICDVAGCVRILSQYASLDDIVANCSPRSKKEILDKADLIYRMDWACVDARIHGLTGPAHMDHGVTQARHKTANWLIGFENQEWDSVDTPT